MALRIVRESLDTPNVTNKDDVIMTRYAYGGYNGFVKEYGNELGYETDELNFTIQSGRAIIDGWEIDIINEGVTIDFGSEADGFYSVYLEIDVARELAEIKYSYLVGTYPEIDGGDDLTEAPNGTARLVLYNIKVENSRITEVVKKVKAIPFLSQIEDDLESGSFMPKNSQQVNGLEIKQDENGVLRVGDIIIPQKRLLHSEKFFIESGRYKEIAVSKKFTNSSIEVHTDYGVFKVTDSMQVIGGQFVADESGSALNVISSPYELILKNDVVYDSVYLRFTKYLGNVIDYEGKVEISAIYEVIE